MDEDSPSMYMQTEIALNVTEAGFQGKISLGRGVRQGYLLSALPFCQLFIIVV